ncbi:MAG: 4-hydroxy-tetrahydrodipicolinate reductase [Patescibacteria group bacterium]
MDERPIQVCIVGARGKMGLEIVKAVKQDPDLTIMWEIDLENAPVKSITAVPWKFAKDTLDVVLNFTNPEATMESAIWCAEHSKPLVTGTTGLSEEQLKELVRLAKRRVPMVFDSNMSLGVNLIDKLLPKFVSTLTGFDIEMVELHNSNKKDSPSGTAIRFAQTLAKAKGGKISFGRVKGHYDERPMNEVVVHSIRGGTVPGEHTIYFIGPDEVIEIHHRALSRRIFVLGALKAAKWVVKMARPGLYNMNDVLGL